METADTTACIALWVDCKLAIVCYNEECRERKREISVMFIVSQVKYELIGVESSPLYT